jgi:hypothetical protein
MKATYRSARCLNDPNRSLYASRRRAGTASQRIYGGLPTMWEKLVLNSASRKSSFLTHARATFDANSLSIPLSRSASAHFRRSDVATTVSISNASMLGLG